MSIMQRRMRFVSILAMAFACPTSIAIGQTTSDENSSATISELESVQIDDSAHDEISALPVSQYTVKSPPASAAPASNSADGAKKKKEALEKAMKEAYKPLFYNNDFSYLSDPTFNGLYFFGDSLKQMVDGQVDVGGELRSRYHHEEGFRGFGLTGRDDEFWLTRVRAFTNYRITKNIRLYGEYLYADSGGETYAPRVIEENRGEAQNLFLDTVLLDDGDYKLTTRVGRQEMFYDSQRLIGPLDWANTRRTFEGYLMHVSNDQGFFDLFYVNPLNRIYGGDTNHWDSADRNQHLYGAYYSTKKFDVGTTELYYLGYDNENTNANFKTNTIGGNVNGGDAILYDMEGGAQFGKAFNGSDIGAGFVVMGLGRKIESFGDWKPTLWGYWDWASGASQAPYAAGDSGFNQILGTVHRYYGYMDLFARRNMHDFNSMFVAPLGKKVDLLLWNHYFLLDRQTTPYNINNTPFSQEVAASKDIGFEYDLLLTFKLDPRSNIVVGYSYFDAGDYYKFTPNLPSRDNAQFFYSQFTRFF